MQDKESSSIRTIFLLLSIFFIGIFLRFYKLTSIPPSLSHDESAIAYNAFSILKTGADEYGIRFPLLFKSFDDYKLPGMVYATVPSVYVFGKSEMAARFPSAFFGTFAILVMYGIAKELFGKNRFLRIGKIDVDSALFPTFMLAVSPWHINFSRQLFESNGAVFWLMLGIYYLLRSRSHIANIYGAGLSFVISLYFYYSVRLVIPFICLVYVLLNWRLLLRQWKTVLFAVLIATVVFFPMGKEMLSKGGMERISMVSITNDPTYKALRDSYVQKIGIHPTIFGKLFYNRRMAFVQTAVENYGKNISFHNLFVTGTGTFGALYKFELVLLAFGFFALWELTPFSRALIVTWLITAFFPGAFSINQPNTLRTLVAAPVFAILSGLGISYVLKKSAKYTSNALLWGSICILLFAFLLEFPKFHYAYFIDNPTHNALAFGDGYKQMVQYVHAHEQEYDQVYVSGYYWRPYVFFLYWDNFDPADYAKRGFREHYGKYNFAAASWDVNGMKFMDPKFDFSKLEKAKQSLFILSYPEYQLHQMQFTKIEEIDGNQTRHVFVATTVR